MRAQNLFKELHRRHVFKSCVAYGVVTWLITQVLDIMIPAFNLPTELIPFFIVVMLVCFPIWLAISWFYDLTEDGIVRTKSVSEAGDNPSTKNINLNKIIITSLSVIVILLIANTFRMKAENKSLKQLPGIENTDGAAESTTPQYVTSIAVLSFADMTPGQDYEHFADAISDEIRNRLFQIKDLKVIGKRSSKAQKYQDVTYPMIAEELGVAYLLEGSIGISKEGVSISADLINLADGSCTWSRSFEPKMEDIFITREEIASTVADQLKVSLLNKDVRLRKAEPEAFLYYSKATEALNQYSKNSTLSADSLIRRSLEIDSSYAPSWSLLSQVYFRKAYHYALLDRDKGYDKGMEAAIRAVELESENTLGYSMLSLFAWQNKEATLAERHIKKALRLAPNDPMILFQAGKLALRTNQLDLAKAYFDKTILLDPNNDLFIGARDIAYYTRSFLNWTLGNLEEAGEDLLRAYTLDLPDYLKNYEMALLYRDKGDYEAAMRRIAEEKDPYLRQLMECSVYFAMGRKQESIKIIEELINYPKDMNLKKHIDSEPEHHYEIACLYAYMEDLDNAFTYLDESFDYIVIAPDRFFTTPEFNNLKEDPRWEEYLTRLGNEFNYNFNAAL